MGNLKRIFILTDAKKITEILLRQDGKKAKNCFDKFENDDRKNRKTKSEIKM